MKIDFANRIRNPDPLILDGAMGTELDRHGVPMDATAWSARAIESHPEVIQRVHADYVHAGADVHIANSFATCRHVLLDAGLGQVVEKYNREAVRLCRNAIATADDQRPRWIAGSISTYAEGSDRSRLPRLQTLRDHYREQAHLLAESGVDLFMLEMMFDVDVSVAAIESAAETGLPICIGLTCQSGEDGESVVTYGSDIGSGHSFALGEILPVILSETPADLCTLIAIMHSEIEITSRALDELQSFWDGPVAVYPNSGVYQAPGWRHETVCSPEEFVEAAVNWYSRGVAMVGGCCGIGPDHIRALSRKISA